MLNWANNLFPHARLDDSLAVRDFRCADLKQRWGDSDMQSSPSRKLSDLLWMHLPRKQIHEGLGQIHVVDVGCGSGKYGTLLTDWSEGKLASYTGIDSVENGGWPALELKNPNLRFVTADGRDFSGHIPDNANFFISQSAVEHFEEDLTFFRQIRDFIFSVNRPIIQVHVIPSRACQRLHRFHGVRQYTPRTVSKITRIFRDFSTAVLYGLGGPESNRLHYEFITRPRRGQQGTDLREQKTSEYDERLYHAIERDMANRQSDPGFYALVIQSNWPRELDLHPD